MPRITDYPAANTPLASDDVLLVDQGGVTKKVNVGQVASLTAPVNATDIADGSVTDTEFQYLNGVTSSLQTQLNAKAASVHTHVIGDVTSLQASLDGKASTVHTHIIGDVTGLQAALDAKAAAAFSTGIGATLIAEVGQTVDIYIPFAINLTGWTVVGDVSGSIEIGVELATYAGYPTTTTIYGSEKPTLSSAQKNQDNTLSTWTTAVPAGSIIRFAVETAATLTKATIVLYGTRA